MVGDLRDRASEARRELEGELGRRLVALRDAGTRALDRARAVRAEGQPKVEREQARLRAFEREVRQIVARGTQTTGAGGTA